MINRRGFLGLLGISPVAGKLVEKAMEQEANVIPPPAPEPAVRYEARGSDYSSTAVSFMSASAGYGTMWRNR